MSQKDEARAEAVVKDLEEQWAARECFFIGLFEKTTKE
jgi:hypothetical protein